MTAERIAANSPLSLRRINQLSSQNGSEVDLQTVQAREFEALEDCYASPEHKEAVAAFLEKRTADFSARR